MNNEFLLKQDIKKLFKILSIKKKMYNYSIQFYNNSFHIWNT